MMQSCASVGEAPRRQAHSVLRLRESHGTLEDARRPSRERETLVRDQTRIVNRVKATLIRFGIRNFKVKLRQAAADLEKLQSPEGEPLPPNTLAELRRDLARLRMIRERIKAIETARRQRLKGAPRWRRGVTGELGDRAVDMTLVLRTSFDNASALPTCPQPPAERPSFQLRN
jgi:transposase